MGEIDNHVAEFKDLFDKDARLTGHDMGEFGFAMAIMRNAITNVWYYLQYQRVWFDTFGSRNKDYYRNLPIEDRGVEGTSMQFKTLAQANFKDKAWIVIRHISGQWYACDAKKWYAYVTKHETFFRKEVSKIDSRIEGGIPLRLLKNISAEGLHDDPPPSGPLDSWT